MADKKSFGMQRPGQTGESAAEDDEEQQPEVLGDDATVDVERR
jgi:hypothetical protein